MRYLLLTILCFSLAGVGYSLSSRQKNAAFNSFCRVNVTEKNAYSDGQYILGLYSTGEAPYAFSFKESDMQLRHVLLEHTKQRVPKPYRIQQVGRQEHIVGVTGKWSIHFYMATPRFEIPFNADVWAGANRLNVTIDNQTPYEVVDCLIYYNGKFFQIDNIAANSRESRNIAKSVIDRQTVYEPGKSNSMDIRGASIESSFFKTMQRSLKEDLRSTLYKTVGADADSQTVYITGWIDADILKPYFSQTDITGRGVTLLSWKGKI
jgi:hypothetical protein